MKMGKVVAIILNYNSSRDCSKCVEYLKTGKILPSVSFLEKVAMMKEHYQILCQDKCEKLALLEIRSHIIWYLKGMPKSKEIKNLICQCKSSEDIFKIINEYSEFLKEEQESNPIN